MVRENLVQPPPRLEEETLQGLRRRGRPRISAIGRTPDSQRKALPQSRHGTR